MLSVNSVKTPDLAFKSNNNRPVNQQNKINYRSLSGDTLCLSKKQERQDIGFLGLKYFVSSGKGRADLMKYAQYLREGTEVSGNAAAVDLPDLKHGQKIDRVILHWTATNKITPGAVTRYHYLVDNKQGNKIYKGMYSITDNARKIDDNRYAAHVHNANSHTAGISLLGMSGVSEDGSNMGSCPITEEQFNQACQLIARMAVKYNINPDNIYSHYEFGVMKDDKNKEKLDIRFLPWDRTVKTEEVGEYIRNRVKQYMESPDGQQGMDQAA